MFEQECGPKYESAQKKQHVEKFKQQFYRMNNCIYDELTSNSHCLKAVNPGFSVSQKI